MCVCVCVCVCVFHVSMNCLSVVYLFVDAPLGSTRGFVWLCCCGLVSFRVDTVSKELTSWNTVVTNPRLKAKPLIAARHVGTDER